MPGDGHPQLPLLGALMACHGGLLLIMGLLLVCSSPIPLMEGEELVVVVFGVLWGIAFAITGTLLGIAGFRVRNRRGRLFALVMLLVQVPVSFCFCGILSISLLMYGVWLLGLDANAIASFE